MFRHAGILVVFLFCYGFLSEIELVAILQSLGNNSSYV